MCMGAEREWLQCLENKNYDGSKFLCLLLWAGGKLSEVFFPWIWNLVRALMLLTSCLAIVSNSAQSTFPCHQPQHWDSSYMVDYVGHVVCLLNTKFLRHSIPSSVVGERLTIRQSKRLKDILRASLKTDIAMTPENLQLVNAWSGDGTSGWYWEHQGHALDAHKVSSYIG